MTKQDEVIRIVFEPPSKDAPGFMRRNKQAMVFYARLNDLQNKPTNEWLMEDTKLFDEMIDFLVPYIKEPADPEAAREALWDASEDDFTKMLSAVQGSDENPPEEAGTKNGESGKSSASTSKDT
jgi:hypothetical protein